MARQQPIPFIRTQPLSVAPKQTAGRIARLVGAAGQLAQTGIGIQTAAIEEGNAKAEAIAKLRGLAEQEGIKQGATQIDEQIRESQRQEQSLGMQTRMLEQSIRQIEQSEKLGIWGAVNSLTPEQLATANASGLGFKSPEAINAVDRAIGERQANEDWPRLLNAIASDESKLPSKHLEQFLKGREFGSDNAGLAYGTTLSQRLSRYQDSAILSRAEKTKGTILQNAIDGFQFEIVTGFRTLDQSAFQNHLAGLYRGLRHANPDLSENEFKAYAVKALEPLFIGPDARFSAVEGYAKLSELFTEDQIESFGLGGAMAQLKRNANKEFADSLGSNISNASNFEQIKSNLAAVKILEDQGAISSLQAEEIRTDAQQRISKVRATEEVRAVADRATIEGPAEEGQSSLSMLKRGQSIVPLTKEHDDAIDRSTDSKGYTGAQAAVYQVKVFGRLTQRTLNQMDALATSVDGQELPEAVAMWQSIAQANPVYAYELTAGERSPLPEKLSAVALDAQARGPAAIRSGAAVPERLFDTAASIFDEPPEGVDQRDAKLDATGFLWWGQPGQTVVNAEQQRAFRSIAISYMARAQAQGEADAASLYKDATKYASKQIKKLYQPMRIAGSVYAVRSDVAGVLRQTEATYDGVQTLARRHMQKLRALTPGGEYRFDFGKATPINDRILIPVMLDGEETNETHWLRIPLSPIQLKEELERTEPLPPHEVLGITRTQYLTGGGAAP